ncbi:MULTISPECIES: mechanosensitive ion channel [Antarcticibacterium]|uniref:mechanosensitive ion channel n=1 Tax=Antarcticibacterium TaxID=2058174 RepID=UPI001FE56DFD|nr:MULTISPECIES: mechanosensitive ion channel [Antarcticibacterium]
MENQFESFGHRIANFLPDLLAALLILLIGWLLARGIKAIIVKLLRKTSWDERVFGKSNVGDTNVFLANIVYYLVMIIVILAVLEVLGINEALAPLGNMLNEFLLFIPNLIGAILIGFIGYLLAKFVSNLIHIGGSFLDRFVDRTGFKDTDKLVRILRKIVFIVIFIPFLIQAFNALQMDAISQPANDVLYAFTEMIGQILVAGLILAVFIWGGKFLANFLEDLFKSMGLDNAAEKIQIHNMIGANQSLSKILANLVYFFLVFFGVITAVEILGLDRLTITLNEILEVTGQIIFGLIILAVGNYISLLIYNTMTRSRNNTFIAGIIRWASLALFIAIALRTMGIANEIVELAFGLILGAIAVAVALSYGLGGREAAGEHFKDIISKLRAEASEIPPERTPDNLTDTSRRTTSPGREPEEPDSPKRGPQDPRTPPGGPENPHTPLPGPDEPNKPEPGPENPDRPNRGPGDPNNPDFR